MSSHGAHGASSRLHLRRAPPPEQGEVLVLLAHPQLGRSRVNRRLAEAIRGIDGVTVHQLYEAYPDLDIDVEREQRLLAGHRKLVWQHPFYWYSTPAILKEWQDLVLTFNWAYGPEGRALAGKPFLQALTTGGMAEAYTHEGHNRHTVLELLAPSVQMARLCGMIPQEPFVVHGTHRLDEPAIAEAAERYRLRVLALRDAPLVAAEGVR